MVDTSLWVDYFRSQTPDAVKRQVDPIARDPETVLCEPVLFELLRAAPKAQRSRLREYLSTLPVLSTPANLWNAASLLGQNCLDRGFMPRAADLLIAQVCLHHQIGLVTFDDHFHHISAVAPLKVEFLRRAVS